MPSVSSLEAAHYELQSGSYSEYDVHAEKRDVDDPATAMTWMSRMFVSSPKAINQRREALLPTATSRECCSNRSSTDVESQASTDASTLLEVEPRERKSKKVDARMVSDAIIGLSDGMTVPFALTAGLSALGNTKVVIFAGLAELTAGAISMGLGGYLGARSEE